MYKLLRKCSKAIKALAHPLSRRALRYGAVPSFEHFPILAALGHIDMVIDVGANVGQFAMAARMSFPEAKIHSFEPISSIGASYRKIMAHDHKATLYTYALGSKTAQKEINVTQAIDSSSLLEPALQSKIFPGTHKIDVEQVDVAPLTSFFSEDQLSGVCLLKIDVQGYEMQVLKGCEGLLGCFDWIYCEASFLELYSGQPLAGEIIKWLTNRGFRLSGVHVDQVSYRRHRAIQADFLFERSCQNLTIAPGAS